MLLNPITLKLLHNTWIGGEARDKANTEIINARHE